MASLETIRRLKVEATSSGVRETTAALQGMVAAQDRVAQSAEGMATTTDRVSRRQLSIAQAVERQRMRDDEAYRNQALYTRGLTTYDKALEQGAITAVEHAAAQERLAQKYKLSNSALNDNVRGMGLARHELVNLSRQAQDVGTMLAMGASPLQVLTSQGAQVFDIFASSQGTVRGFLDQMKSGLLSVVTPARLAFGGVVAGVGLAVAALHSYASEQQKIAMQLTGSGRASGLTVSGINSIANSASSLTGLSVSEARNFAAELASSGRIGRENIEPLVKMGHDFATAFGVDAADAAKTLAKAMADPAKGAQELNSRLGFLDAGMLSNIRNLQEQGRLYQAQRVLQDGMSASLRDVNGAISSSSKFWSALGNGISNAWDKIGEVLSRGTGIGFIKGLDDQIRETQDRIRELEQIAAARSAAVNRGLGTTASLDRERETLRKLTEQWQDYQRSVEDAQRRQMTFAVQSAIDKQMPEVAEIQSARNELILLQRQMDEVNRSGGAQSEMLIGLERTYPQLAAAIELLTGKLQALTKANGEAKNSFDRQLESLQLQNKAIGAKGPAALGEIAFQQTLQGLGSNSDQARQVAEQARQNAIKQFNQQVSDSMREQLLSAQQRVETAGLELRILGSSSSEMDRQRSILQAKQQLEQEALRNYGNRDAYDRKHLEALTAQINQEAKLKQMLAEQQALRDTTFDRSQIGRTSDEQQIASKLRGIYNDGYESQMNGTIAQQMRFNQQLQFTHDLGADAFKGMISDLQQGKTLGEAFGNSMTNMLNKVANKLADMAFNNLWNAAFGGNSAGGLFSLLGMGGGAGGATGSLSMTATTGLWANGGAFDRGNVIPFAHGGIVNRPTVFPMANGAGLMGEAGPEAIMPLRRGPDGRLGVQAASAAGAAMGGSIRIEVASTVDKNGNITTYVRKVAGQVAGQAVSVSAPGIVKQSVGAVADRSRNAPSYIRKAV